MSLKMPESQHRVDWGDIRTIPEYVLTRQTIAYDEYMVIEVMLLSPSDSGRVMHRMSAFCKRKILREVYT